MKNLQFKTFCNVVDCKNWSDTKNRNKLEQAGTRQKQLQITIGTKKSHLLCWTACSQFLFKIKHFFDSGQRIEIQLKQQYLKKNYIARKTRR